ncbi:unnamed protein product [Lepeophtheirus salmonis]|uniref:(salmon louse) hypothetical protein n=1 Tax=Lepeophtheirus salmonis TaxID=72036 RepID=A0A7R8CP85_LEPSM|nr:unnamed protein product [Lepeophtheirus salmonis]CAF2880560.1 unnamed protein product [Lepeophtheirus salmonis]
MFLNYGIRGQAPTLDRWLSVFFRELSRNVSPEVLEESVMKNVDKLVLIQIPQSNKSNVSTWSSSWSLVRRRKNKACMKIDGYKAQPLSNFTPTPKDTYEKSLALLLKLYPDIKVSLPFTPEEVQNFIKKQGYEDKKANDLEEEILDIQSRDNYLSRSIPTLENLYERASSRLQEEEEKEPSILLKDDSDDYVSNELDDSGFEDPFFSVDSWDKTGDNEETFPNPRSNQNEEELDLDISENDKGNDEETDYDNDREYNEEMGINRHDDDDERFTLDTENSLGSAFDVEELDKARLKTVQFTYKQTKYETVLGILLTILAFVAIIVLIYIYRRQQRSRMFQVSGPSTPSSRTSPNEHNIFEPQILQMSKEDPEGSFITEDHTATIKTGQLLAVKDQKQRSPKYRAHPQLLTPQHPVDQLIHSDHSTDSGSEYFYKFGIFFLLICI